MEQEWHRLNDSRLRNVGGRSTHVLSLRAYGIGKRRWPRLVLTVWRWGEGELRVEMSRKNSSKGFWEGCSLPASLVGDLAEMLGEAQARME